MKSILKNFIYNSLYQILVMIIPLVTAPYLARVVGAEGVGKYSFAYSIAYYFYIFIKMGLDNYGSRAVAANRSQKKNLQRIFWEIYALQFLCGVVFVGLYVLYSLFIAKDNVAAWILLLFVVSGMLDVNWLFSGLEMFKLTVARSSLVKLAATIGIFVFVKEAKDIYIYILIMAASFFISQIIIWPFVFRIVTFEKIKIEQVMRHLKPNAILFVAILAVSLYRYMDKIMLGTMINEAEVGFYENADKLMQIPISFVNALGVVMLPRMSAIYSNKENEPKSNDVIFISIMFAMFLSSAICMGIMSISDNLVPVFLGVGYDKCIELLMILMPSCLFMSFANVIRTQYIIPKNRDTLYVITIMIGAMSNLVINTLMIPNHGAYGAAIGTLCAEISVCVSQVILVRRSLQVRKYICFSTPFIISGAVMYLVVKFFEKGRTIGLHTLFESIVLGALVYMGVLALLAFPFRKNIIARFGKER